MADTDFTTLGASSKDWTPEERVLIDANTMDADVFADRVFEQLEAAPAFLSNELVYELEEEIQRDQIRRAAFALASMSGADMIAKIESDRDFAVIASGISDGMPDLEARYIGLAKLFELIGSRIMIALCSREDMMQVREEGKSVIS